MKYSFETALVYLKRGHKITRTKWNDSHFLYLKPDGNSIGECFKDGINKRIDGTDFDASLSSEDVLAEDWVVVDEG